jgi:hypothetical protein
VILGMGRSCTVGEPFPFPDRAQPQDADIVILVRLGSEQTWSILRHPGPAQITAESRQQAMAIARAIAPELGVDVWCLEAGTYSLLEAHRGPEGRVQRSKAVRSPERSQSPHKSRT